MRVFDADEIEEIVEEAVREETWRDERFRRRLRENLGNGERWGSEFDELQSSGGEMDPEIGDAVDEIESLLEQSSMMESWDDVVARVESQLSFEEAAPVPKSERLAKSVVDGEIDMAEVQDRVGSPSTYYNTRDRLKEMDDVPDHVDADRPWNG